jgi:hypothetical protein
VLSFVEARLAVRSPPFDWAQGEVECAAKNSNPVLSSVEARTAEY